MILGLAPMDGITDCAYRLLTKRIFGQYNKNENHELRLWTEFMNVHGYLINPPKVVRHMLTVPTATKTIAQIYGGDQEKLLEAALKLEKDYKDIFYGIELNIGCPSPKVMASGGGSGMLREKDQTLETIKILSEKLTLPFSIKTRSGLTAEDNEAQFTFVLEASNYCHMMAIHGRTLKQSHSGDVDWQFIYDVKKEVGDSCKIIGNGGITSYEDGLEKLGNLDGIMIGQSAIGNPWTFVQDTPSREELHYWTIEHLHTAMACELYFEDQTADIADLDPNFVLSMPTLEDIEAYKDKAIANKNRKFFSIIEFRKFLFNYVKGIPGSKEFKVQVSRIGDYRELKNEIDTFFSI